MSTTPELQTAIGGSTVEITTPSGTTEKVFVRQLPVKLWDEAIEVALDEGRFIELVSGKESGWAGKVLPEARTLLAEEAERQNADFFAYLARRSRMVNRLAPDMLTKAAKAAMR